MILVDANVLIDVLGVDQQWHVWSRTTMRDFNVAGEDLVINTVVLAEIAGNAPDLASLVAALTTLDIEVLSIDQDSAFAAGQAYRRYRREPQLSNINRVVLADFLIGAHAMQMAVPVLTRDARLYRRYFPDLPLITPETHP